MSNLSHSVVFLYFFAFITEEGFLISSCYSLELCIQMLISFLFSCALCCSSFHNYLQDPPPAPPPPKAILLFGISFRCGWSGSLSPVQCHKSPSIVHQVLYLSGLVLKSISHFHCIIIRNWIYLIPERSIGFPYFLHFKSEFGNRSS